VARQLLGMTLKHLRAAVVTLVIVGGLPGTGKSTLSAAVAGRLGFAVLSSDQIRKELAGISPDDHHPRRRARAAVTAGAQRHPPARSRAHLAAHPAVHAARVTLEQRRLREVAAKVISLAATFWAAV
jgi:hypothetical protein